MCFVEANRLKISFREMKPILAMIIALSSTYAMACSCFYGGKFQEYSASFPIVVRGTVSSYGDTLRNREGYFSTMYIDVSDVVKGDFSSNHVELQGDTGMSCFKFITNSQFPIGSEHLFLITNNQTTQPLWGCGESSVRIIGDFAEGIDGNGTGFYRIKLEELVDLIR